MSVSATGAWLAGRASSKEKPWRCAAAAELTSGRGGGRVETTRKEGLFTFFVIITNVKQVAATYLSLERSFTF